MNRTKTVIGIVVAAIFLIGSAYIFVAPSSSGYGSATSTPPLATVTPSPNIPANPPKSVTPAKPPTPPKVVAPTPTPTPTPTPPKASGFTMADVQAHATSKSCWTAISGNVYDLTSWINQHPGGSSAIISLCGIDGTSAFLAQHGGQRRPEQELASLLLGSLSQ